MKKIISILLAVLMLFSVMSVMAYAADGDAKDDTTVVEEETEEETEKKTLPIFEDLKDKVTLPEFAFSDIGGAAIYVVFFPLLALLQGLLIIVFVVLDILNLDLSDLGISL